MIADPAWRKVQVKKKKKGEWFWRHWKFVNFVLLNITNLTIAMCSWSLTGDGRGNYKLDIYYCCQMQPMLPLTSIFKISFLVIPPASSKQDHPLEVITRRIWIMLAKTECDFNLNCLHSSYLSRDYRIHPTQGKKKTGNQRANSSFAGNNTLPMYRCHQTDEFGLFFDYR